MKNLWLRYWHLLAVIIQQFFQASFTESPVNPCQGLAENDIRVLPYGSVSFIQCESTGPRQTGTTKWFQDGQELVESTANLTFQGDNEINIDFTTSEREGRYNCTYQEDENADSVVTGKITPMCIIVLGIPRFEECQEVHVNEPPCSTTDSPIPNFIGNELRIAVAVVYVGGGPSGVLYSVSTITVSNNNDMNVLMSCSTLDESMCTVSTDDIGDIKERISGSIATDDETYVNATFVINPTSVNDSGEYVVSVAAQYEPAASFTTITMILSATPRTPSPLSLQVNPTSSSDNVIESTTAISTGISIPTPIPTSNSPPRSPDSIIIIVVAIVAGVIIAALLLGIASVCLFIFRGMCPKLKKEIIKNVQLMRMRPRNGIDDAATICTDGPTAQVTKTFGLPDFELPHDKNSETSRV